MILILGRNGQLAKSLLELDWDEPVISLDSTELDLSKPDLVQKTLSEKVKQTPRLIFNAAAYTAVDKAESERELAFAVNANAVAEIGKWTQAKNSTLIHFSTDYVYPGVGDTPASVDDTPGPINAYGESKLQGERELTNSKARFFIFRISWVVSPFGNNFVKTMLKLAAERDSLSIVDDQWGSPMSSLAVAALMHRCFHKSNLKWQNLPSEIYNLSAEPFVSWYGFATEIFKVARAQGRTLKVENVSPIPSQNFPTPARRPKNSRMSDLKFRRDFGDHLPPWKDDLTTIVRRLS